MGQGQWAQAERCAGRRQVAPLPQLRCVVGGLAVVCGGGLCLVAVTLGAVSILVNLELRVALAELA